MTAKFLIGVNKHNYLSITFLDGCPVSSCNVLYKSAYTQL